jgi:xanthine dehydrogenase accessory factor
VTLYDTLREGIERGVPLAMVTVVAGPRAIGARMLVHADGSTEGDLGDAELRARVVGDSLRHLQTEVAASESYPLKDGTYDVFIDVYPAPHRLVIVGGGAAARPLAALGRMLGYHVVVTDARAAFAQPERFPEAHEVIKGWPEDVLPRLELDENTYVVLLSHDPKFDEPTLRIALPTDVPYIGAIGSRKTQRERFERLRAQGYDEAQLARVYGPVGMDIGSRTPEETALAILAEITAVRRGKRGGFLRDRV